MEDYLDVIFETQDLNQLVTWGDVARDIEEWIQTFG